MPLPRLQAIDEDAETLLELLLSDGQQRAGLKWLTPSAFHGLRARAPTEHPGFGVALLHWQRVRARWGERSPAIAAQAFLALPRAGPDGHFAARILELWIHHVHLPVEASERLRSLPTLPRDEAALVAEDLALGGYELGRPSPGVLRAVAGLAGDDFAHARTLARVELFAQDLCDADALCATLAPALFGREDEGGVSDLTFDLLGVKRLGSGYLPALTPGLREVVERVQVAAARVRAGDGFHRRNAALRVIPCARPVSVAALAELLEPDRAVSLAGVRFPPPLDEVATLAHGLDEARAVRLALALPALAAAVEGARGLPGLTHWVASLAPRVPEGARRRTAEIVGRERQLAWMQWGGAPTIPLAKDQGVKELLSQRLREGTAIPLEQALRWNAVLFQSPAGPGLLEPDGSLRNGVRQWDAPAELALAHPVELYDAERRAWQARLLALGATAPVNQVFREVYRPGGSERGRTRLERLRGAALGQVGLDLLEGRGWFPLLAPAEARPELELGGVRARLHVGRRGEELVFAGLEFERAGRLLALADVPPHTFSEAWRDLDEALALSMAEPSWVPCPSRAELVCALLPKLMLARARVEADHLAFRSPRGEERLTLHNAQCASAAVLAPAEARALGAPRLPFTDDGGMAAILVGRAVALGQGEAVQPQTPRPDEA